MAFLCALLLGGIALTTLWFAPRPRFLLIATGSVLAHAAVQVFASRRAGGERLVRAASFAASAVVFFAAMWYCGSGYGFAAFAQGMLVWCLSMALQLVPTFLLPRTPSGARPADR
jgi:hypothetical protein